MFAHDMEVKDENKEVQGRPTKLVDSKQKEIQSSSWEGTRNFTSRTTNNRRRDKR